MHRFIYDKGQLQKPEAGHQDGFRPNAADPVPALQPALLGNPTFHARAGLVGNLATQHLPQEKGVKDRYLAASTLFPSGEHLRWLDVGSGAGRLYSYIDPYSRAAALEKNPELVAKTPLGIEAVEGDFNLSWPFDPESFDVLTAISVIQYATRVEHIFKEANRVLKPEGTFIVEFPNFDFMGGFIRPSMFTKDCRIESEFSIKDIVQLGRDNGFIEYGPFPVGRFQFLKGLFIETLSANVIVRFLKC